MTVNFSSAGKTLGTHYQFLILLALWAVTFYPVYPGMVAAWLNHSNNSHGMLVPFITLFFIWQNREKLRSAEVSTNFCGALLLAGSLLIYLLAYIGGIAAVMRSMIVFSLAGLVLYVLGKRIFRMLLFPLFFLLFMVPVPDAILNAVAFPLQLFATKVSAGVIQFCSIPVYREGNMLYFVQTQLEVAEACSGIRSLTALVMLSVIFMAQMRRGWMLKAVILFSAVPVALAANILRVSGTGILAHFFGDQVAKGFLHEFSGLAVFAFGLIILFIEFSLLNRFGKKGEPNKGQKL
jgi:exosortase